MGGGNASSSRRTVLCRGLSPRGRGKQQKGRSMTTHIRSIPAWAGETIYHLFDKTLDKVYPRVGGGNLTVDRFTTLIEGLSPRGRGKRLNALCAQRIERSIPAWAGETERWGCEAALHQVYPRVGGGNAHIAFCCPQGSGLSPRGRGKLSVPNCRALWERSIPAWAGETRRKPKRLNRNEVYPRVGGGNGVLNEQRIRQRGLSPRGRGKPFPS